eukprot:366569-Chlamydomonas_euryale.AAC.47
MLVAVADRLDSLVGLFAAGCAPTASADPYGLRRAAYGMLQVWRTVVWTGVAGLTLKNLTFAGDGANETHQRAPNAAQRPVNPSSPSAASPHTQFTLTADKTTCSKRPAVSLAAVAVAAAGTANSL